MASVGVWDTVLLYSFVKRLVMPFTRWKAYQTGVIDNEGNIVVPKEDRSNEQKKSFKLFDLLVLNLKRLLGKVPGGKTKIASYAAALWLLREGLEATEELNEEQLLEKISIYMDEAQMLLEDAPVNNASSGEVAGLDDNPARPKNKKKKNVIANMFRRNREMINGKI